MILVRNCGWGLCECGRRIYRRKWAKIQRPRMGSILELESRQLVQPAWASVNDNGFALLILCLIAFKHFKLAIRESTALLLCKR